MPESSVRISLKYRGSEVDDATMPIGEVILALQGFSGAYGKVASSLLPDSSHELRVTAIKDGSFDLAILAWIASSQGNETLTALKYASTAAKYVFGVVKGVIDAKKHTKGNTYHYEVSGSNNTLLIVNTEGGKIEATAEVVDILKRKYILYATR